MPDYKKMYAILCSAVDDVIDPLGEIPLALPSVRKLQGALLEAEEVYLRSTEEEECKVRVVPFVSVEK